MFYKAKEKFKRDVTVELYQTKSIFASLMKAYDHAIEVPSIKFCYADVNCRLKLKFNDKNQKDLFSHPLMICLILKTRKYSFVHDFLNKFS